MARSEHIAGWIGVAAACAILWAISASITVPENQDTFIRELQRAAWWNGLANLAGVIGALSAGWIFLRGAALKK
jgi:hypothetical protein